MSAFLLGAGRFSVPGHATAITGNPAVDLWTFEGLSSSPSNYNNGAGAGSYSGGSTPMGGAGGNQVTPQQGGGIQGGLGGAQQGGMQSGGVGEGAMQQGEIGIASCHGSTHADVM